MSQVAPPIPTRSLQLVDRERDALGVSVAQSLRLMRGSVGFAGDKEALEAVLRKLQGLGFRDPRPHR